ncbi:MAG: hypothetical protein PWP07_147 [Epulopiscium sp.]|uniref:hypothetical protein n=1 Tax=Defluviitalea raffinosedens TaxID=1450156 RepID=UPI001772E0A1|nr:hypothetical protein [Defluviitalea raffinosedens]MBM7685028.1 rubrerythrin [Defluviitalea raffinosedens]MBZ4666901.1 rubrerythrin family protein [Defluviitaleaceae bacterium]MDK2786922.1 hypothetical protein [Candidatus Epulonipiscium sp.]HHW67508.1 hypothetical protein [Candidatus Epulonipiscium sp.]
MYFQQPYSYYEQPMMGEISSQTPYQSSFMPIPPPVMPVSMPNTYIKHEYKGAELIEEAAKRERRMAYYDEKIMGCYDNELDRKRIYQILLNQRRHEKMLGEIYYGMTGRKLSCDIKEPGLPEDLKENLDQRIFQGFESIEIYRKIYFSVVPPEWKMMLFEIIGDEQNDLLKYIYYCSKINAL